MIVYFDTSAVLKRVLGEPGEELAYDLWDSADLLVSSEIIYPEARAAAGAAQRAGRITPRQLRDAVREIDRLYGSFETVHVDGRIASSAGEMAERHRLHGHDAVHLATAVGISSRRVVVATWDRALAKASTANGLGVVPAQQVAVQDGELALR